MNSSSSSKQRPAVAFSKVLKVLAASVAGSLMFVLAFATGYRAEKETSL